MNNAIKSMDRIHVMNGHVFFLYNKQSYKFLIEDIDYIKCEGNYCKIVICSKSKRTSFLLRNKMCYFLSLLASPRLIKIHRSYIINIGSIKKIFSSLIIIGDSAIPYSKSRSTDLFNALTVI